MFSWILQKIAGDYNQRILASLYPLVDKINQFDREWMSYSDEAIKQKTGQLRQRYLDGEHIDSLLPEAYATVKQACRRLQGQQFEVKGQIQTRDMVPYDSQLIGGIVLHQSRIAEMKTGEGKTLVASLPAYLNALTGKGVHVVTVNDYLASRDGEWMGYLYQRLGLSVGVVVKGTPLGSRRELYSRDIVYVENAELGFDYLRDNLVKKQELRTVLQRPLHFAIVDEVDSIFIDEARTPLIISEPSVEPTEKYISYAKLVNFLKPCRTKKKVSKGFLKDILDDNNKDDPQDDGDYYIDEKTKSVLLSSEGIKKIEQMLGIENLYRDVGYDEIHHIENALRAKAVFQKDKDYIVNGNEVLIIDEHTGRAMPGRRYSDGLHQAIEAKENVVIQRESKTIATITYQNFFKLYEKIAGMTGTATTEAEEFEKIYHLEVVAIPTNRPVIRVDHNDKVYFNQKAKRKHVLESLTFYHEMGQPILVGTSSIATSEFVSSLLQKARIKHSVLNAKFHEQEANIVAHAGNLGSVVVATNMAGRGTDIKLAHGLNQQIAANYASWIEKMLKHDQFLKRGPQSLKIDLYSELEYNLTIEAIKKHFDLSDENIRQAVRAPQIFNNFFELHIVFPRKKRKKSDDVYVHIFFKPIENIKAPLVHKAFHYGLFILGTEKHESRRIDNQLRGRAGRQGDPGVSVFFVALDDEIMRKMGGEKIQSLAGFMFSQQELEQLELTQSQFTASLERAQKQMEGRNFSIRKHLFDYDSVINKQRQRIYAKREILLQAESLDATISEIKKFLPSIAQKIIDDHKHLEDSKQQIIDRLSKDFSIVGDFGGTISHKIVVEQLEQRFDAIVDGLGDKKDLIRNIYLDMIDKLWIEHIDDMQYLREKVSLYGYAQIDPLIVYKSEAFQKFEQLLHSIKYETTATLCKISLEHMSVSSQHDQSSIVDIQQKIDILPNEFVSKSQSSHPDRKDAYVVADQSPHQPNQKFQRNQMVTITKNGQEKTIKYKKAELLLTQGWVIKK